MLHIVEMDNKWIKNVMQCFVECFILSTVHIKHIKHIDHDAMLVFLFGKNIIGMLAFTYISLALKIM